MEKYNAGAVAAKTFLTQPYVDFNVELFHGI
jgi:hypothetical protein